MTVASVKVKKEERADPFLVLQDLKDHAEPLCRPLSRVECKAVLRPFGCESVCMYRALAFVRGVLSCLRLCVRVSWLVRVCPVLC